MDKEDLVEKGLAGSRRVGKLISGGGQGNEGGGGIAVPGGVIGVKKWRKGKSSISNARIVANILAAYDKRKKPKKTRKKVTKKAKITRKKPQKKRAKSKKKTKSKKK